MENTCKFCENDCVFFKNFDRSKISNELLRYDATFGVGETIVKEQTPQDYIIFVKTGMVKLVVDTAHHNVIFSVTDTYAGFPCQKFEKHQKATYSIIALTDVNVCLFSIANFHEIVEVEPIYNQKLLNSNQYFLNCLIDVVKIRSSKTLTGRLAQKLIYFSRNLYRSPKFSISLNRQELADFVGGSKEAVIRELRKLKEDGIIDFNGHNFRILDFDRLKKIYLIS